MAYTNTIKQSIHNTIGGTSYTAGVDRCSILFDLEVCKVPICQNTASITPLLCLLPPEVVYHYLDIPQREFAETKVVTFFIICNN